MRTVIALTALSLVFASAPVASQVAMPDTLAGRTLAAWLQAFNNADREALRAFYERHDPTASIDTQLAFAQRTGGFDVLSIVRSEPLTIEFTVKERASATRGVARLRILDAASERIDLLLRQVPPGSTPAGFTVDAAARESALKAISAKIEELYVFPDVAVAMGKALASHAAQGDYDEVTDAAEFAQLLTAHLRDVSHDLHVGVTFSPVRMPERRDPELQRPEPTPDERDRMRRQLGATNCGFERAEVLPQNIGYLKLNMFAAADICGPTATAAFGSLQDSAALIIDLRSNGGGETEMVAFVSTYLFADRVHLNDFYTRFSGETQESWTLSSVAGQRLAATPVFVLTSARTFSAAEEFTYNLKSLKRATIVGETTGGGAHPMRAERVSDQFFVSIPFARAINPITGMSWEGTGVEPDVKVPADDALAKALELARAAVSAPAPAGPAFPSSR